MALIELNFERTCTHPDHDVGPYERSGEPTGRVRSEAASDGATRRDGADLFAAAGDRTRLIGAFLVGAAAGSLATHAHRRRRESQAFTEIELESERSPVDG